MSNILAIILIITSVTFLYAKENNNLHESAPGMGIQYASERSTYIKIVDPGGNGDYRTIKDAVSDSRPGWTILVKNGTYNRKLNFTTSGTAANPITVKPYLGHKPVLDFSDSPDEYPRVEINARHIIFEGFEILNGWDGIKVYGDNNIIRYNKIHKNNLAGVIIVNAGRNLIERNIIDSNGVGPGRCTANGAPSPKHCHGIYISNYKCGGGNDGNVLRRNHILNHGGRGIQWNGSGCDNPIEDTLVEYNLIENNSWGMALYYGVRNSVIRNNTFISRSRPDTNDTAHTFIGIYGSRHNTIENNVFDAQLPDVSGLFVFDKASSNNRVNNNTWKLNYQVWVWEGDWRDDWKNYKAVTGWGKNSVFQSDRRTGSFNSVKQLQ